MRMFRYRINFYDNAGKLICWYTTSNKSEAESVAKTKLNEVKVSKINVTA